MEKGVRGTGVKGWSARLARVAALCSIASFGLASGCASSSESARSDAVTSNVGRYDAPPTAAAKPRVGVPPFNVKTGEGFGGGGTDLNDLAADQMTTLMDATDRFRVIERAQLEQLLKEQNLEGIVKPGEMAKSAQVRGVDYLLLGRVTNLRMKREETSRGFGLGQVGGLVQLGGADAKKKDIVITTEAGVDIRLVDPTTGEVVMSSFSEYKKTDAAGAFGLDILGASAEADAKIEIDEDDKGKILRLALDDALRKSLPKLDRFLTSGRVRQETTATAPPAAAIPAAAAVAPAAAAPAVKPAAAKAFCANCGKELVAGAKFCASCGTKTE
ncbi:MAG TPA: CsgG/HfaB family protein [Tepidisphaeraceae bacterium]|jgi:curli biogenesis system outer membrane secretion channel CsgG